MKGFLIDKLFFVILILNATGLFSFIAPQIGVSIGQVSVVLLGINILYLIAKIRYIKVLFSRGRMWGWLFVLGFWPLLTVLHAPSFEVRQIGLQLYFVTLFTGAAVYAINNGLQAVHRVLSVSLVITVFGLVMSLIAPQYFEAVSELASAEILREERSFGFLLQPNQLAVSMIFLFIGWFALCRFERTFLSVLAILTFLFAMLLTGSRTGMLMAVIIVVFIQLNAWKRKWMSGRFVLTTGVLIACLLGGAIGINYYLSSVGSPDIALGGDLKDRIGMFLSFRFSSEGDLTEDTSVQLRLMTQTVYWALVMEKPFLGHGFGSDIHYLETGPIFLSAHSDALRCAMEYGFIYLIIFALLMIQTYLIRCRHEIEKVLQTNAVGQFAFVTVLLFIVASIMDSRTFYVILGIFLAQLYCPRHIFRFEEKTGRIDAILSRREIYRRFLKKKYLYRPGKSYVDA